MLEHFDVPALRELMASLRARRTTLVSVDTDTASPFARSLLFAWIAVYMYEGDAPLAERRAAALSLDRELLRDLLGDEDLRELLDPAQVDQVELELQRLADDRRVRGADGVHDLLRDLGPMTRDQIAIRTRDDAGAAVTTLLGDGRVFEAKVAGVPSVIAAEDAARLRDALGVRLPPGLPVAFTGDTERPLDDLLLRFARTHGPFLAEDAAAALGLGVDRARAALEALAAHGAVLEGAFRPGGHDREWCHPDVLRRIRRRSLAALRREVEPVDAAALGRFLPAWQRAVEPSGRVDALAEAVGRLQGAPVAASIWERDVLTARVRGYRPADLDAMLATGDLVWAGAGALGPTDGRIVVAARGATGLLPPSADPPSGRIHDAIRGHLTERGASFWPDLVTATGTADPEVLLAAVWDLVWAGELTNDTLAPVRALLEGRRSRRRAGSAPARPRPGAMRVSGPPAGAGRWSLVETLRTPAPPPTERAVTLATVLLDRHGVITREAVLAEGVPGGFAALYPVLRAMEESGSIRRGYFVAGLGAAQFAAPGAVDRLRSERSPSGEPVTVTLAAADPAQPYGAALAWPETPGRPSRIAGAYVALAGGSPVVFVERGGRSIATFTGSDPSMAAEALVGLVKDGRLRRLEVRRIDGADPGDHPVASALRERGATDGYRGLILRG
jgi:ATP-dependent Lhr-like helicase